MADSGREGHGTAEARTLHDAAEDLHDLSRLLEPGTQAEALCNRALATLDAAFVVPVAEVAEWLEGHAVYGRHKKLRRDLLSRFGGGG